ncbi:MAG: hypothetical protein PUB10_06635 [Clostridiales bacterium]|nr:hypothetical protein [Clostridiales bacterium]
MKKDRRKWLLVFLPVIAVAFSLIILVKSFNSNPRVNITKDNLLIPVEVSFDDRLSELADKCNYEETEQLTDEDPGVVTSHKSYSNTYTTRYGKVNQVSCPTFCFDYPDGWTVASEDIDELPNLFECDTLSNPRGIEITYMSFSDSLGGDGRFMYEYEITKVSDSSFVPGYPEGTDKDCYNLGDFMVAKIKMTGELNMETDEDFKPIDGGVFYTVVPQSYKGKHETQNLYEECAFEYPTEYVIMVSSPDGRYTTEEEEEVIHILSSFRLKN